MVRMRNLSPRFASLTPMDWPTLAVSSKMGSTRRVLLDILRSTWTPSLRFSSSPLVPSRASLSAPTMRSLPCPPISLIHVLQHFLYIYQCLLHWSFSLDTVPQTPQDAPQRLLNNPASLQRKYVKIRDDPNMRKRRVDLRNAVKAGEQNALKMLAKLFD